MYSQFGWHHLSSLAHDLEEVQYDLYLLLSPDIEWEEDPLRENQEDREALFLIYLEQLKIEKKPFVIIKGKKDERFRTALKAIEEISKK